MIDLPDHYLIQLIQKQYTYFDKKSLEKFTLKIKEKYKIAGHFFDELEIYTFFPVTKNKEACGWQFRVCIKKDEWENRLPGHLHLDCSYVSVKNVDVLSKNEILVKIKDPQNGLEKVARLSDSKFSELRETWHRAKVTRGISRDVASIIDGALGEANIPTKILKDLGLL